MIDNFALALIHALLAIAGWRLVQRTDLDADPALEGEETPPAPARGGKPVGPRRRG